MPNILLVLFQTLTGAEVKRVLAPREPVGKFCGNKHAADGVARHLATMRVRRLVRL
jgi:hypothetical protein